MRNATKIRISLKQKTKRVLHEKIPETLFLFWVSVLIYWQKSPNENAEEMYISSVIYVQIYDTNMIQIYY